MSNRRFNCWFESLWRQYERKMVKMTTLLIITSAYKKIKRLLKRPFKSLSLRPPPSLVRRPYPPVSRTRRLQLCSGSRDPVPWGRNFPQNFPRRPPLAAHLLRVSSTRGTVMTATTTATPRIPSSHLRKLCKRSPVSRRRGRPCPRCRPRCAHPPAWRSAGLRGARSPRERRLGGGWGRLPWERQALGVV